ncbi:MAG: C1 family peptidase, partial [Spartobacteria bacterium]
MPKFIISLALGSVFIPALFAQGRPASYDLRSAGGTQAWVPEIQNQGAAEDCWTFAAATAMNSNLLKTGLLPASQIPPPISISSWHLSTNNGAPDALLASEAFSSSSNWAGWNFQALGYVTRGSGIWPAPGAPPEVLPGVGFRFQQTMGGGPVLDSQNPTNPFPKTISNFSGYPAYLGQLVPSANQPIAFRVGSMSILDQGFSNNVPLPPQTGNATIDGRTYATFDFNLGAADPQVQAVKDAILANGAATTSMNTNGQFQAVPGTPTNTVLYFNNQTAPAYLDHTVTIIGWDDTYTMVNPANSATTTGAWLVQNSWGTTGWENSNGTFWASYNDPVIGRVSVNSYTMLDNSPYSGVVLQNELGPVGVSEFFAAVNNSGPTAYLPASSGMATVPHHKAAGILTPDSGGELRALGLFTQLADVMVEVEIFDSWENGPSGLLGGGNFTLDAIGYFQVELPQALSLAASDPIVVQLTYLDAQTLEPAPGALGITIGGSGLNIQNNTVASGLSYYLDSAAWTDFATIGYPILGTSEQVTGGVLFVKGITSAIPTDFTWTGANATGDWNNSANWADGVVPGNGTVAYFCTSNQTAIDTQTSQNLGGIIFDNCATSYTISNNTINLTGSVVNNSPNNQTITSNLTIANSLAFISANGSLTVGGSVAVSTNTTVLAVGGNAPTVISGQISGHGALALASNNNLVLAANNTFTGGTTLLSGTLQAMAPSALGHGSLTLSGGSLQVGAQDSPAIALGGITFLDWASTNSTIAIAGAGNISVSGYFTNGGFSGNRTFYFAQPELLQVGNNTLVTFGGANFTQSGFVATGPSNISLNGTFQLLGHSLVYTLAGGSASGNVIDSGSVPAWVTFDVSGSVTASGVSNTVNGLNFTNNGSLAIQSNGQLVVTSGT